MKLLSGFVALFLAIFAVAAPSPSSAHYTHLSKRGIACNTAKPKLVLPDNQTTLALPAGDISFVLLGVGYQNYTCAGDKYTPAGALAQLFDLSCPSEHDSTFFDMSQDIGFDLFSKFINLDTYSEFASRKIGDHFFQSNGSGTIVPVWDFRGASTPNQINAFVVATKVGGLPAPNSSTDVDWLELKGISGGLASSIYRTHTKGGQPPSTPCNGSEDTVIVKYVAKYWLYDSHIIIL